MRRTGTMLMLPLLAAVLCGCPTVAIKATPSQLACPGDLVTLSWGGARDKGLVTISAEPPVVGFPLTGDPGASIETSISQDTTFTAKQRTSNPGRTTIRVPTPPLTEPVTVSVSPVCPASRAPHWPFSPASNLVASPRAIVKLVRNPSFEVQARHSGLYDVIQPDGSSNAFEGTSFAADWLFQNPDSFGPVCPRDGITDPFPTGGGVVDPATLSTLTITIDATCPG